MTLKDVNDFIAALALLTGAVGAIVNGIRINGVRKEVSHNHGSSMKDAITRIERNQTGLMKSNELLVKDVSSLGHQIGELRESANVVHADYAARLRRLEEKT